MERRGSIFATVLICFLILPDMVRAEPTVLLRVPGVRQHTVYACGAAALQAVLAYYGIDVRQDTLMEKLGTNEVDGTSYKEIVRVSQEYGLNPTIVFNMKIEQLIADINHGVPSIIAIQAWVQDSDPRDLDRWTARTEDGHYVVAIGYDNTSMYFEDPAMFGIGYIGFDELNARWHDYDQSGARLDHFAITFEGSDTNSRTSPYNPIN